MSLNFSHSMPFPKFVRKNLLVPFVLTISACGGGTTVGLVETETSTGSVVVEQDDEPTAFSENNRNTLQALELIETAANRGGARLMSVGDSITHGTGGTRSYRQELLSLLNDAECSFTMVGSQSGTVNNNGFYSAHEGYSGHTADFFLTGMETNSGINRGIRHSVDNQKPDIVLLHVGSVDLFKEQTVASTLADIDLIIATIHDAKPDTLILIANIIPWFDGSENNGLPASIRALGEGIEQMVRESTNSLLTLVDVRSGFDESFAQVDGVHPNDAGDRHIADAFFDVLHPTPMCR